MKKSMGVDLYFRFKKSNGEQSISVAFDDRMKYAIAGSGKDLYYKMKVVSGLLAWKEEPTKSFTRYSSDFEDEVTEGEDFEVDTQLSMLVVSEVSENANYQTVLFKGFEPLEVATIFAQVFKMPVFSDGVCLNSSGKICPEETLPLNFRKKFLGYKSLVEPWSIEKIEQTFHFLRWESFSYGNKPDGESFFGLGDTSLLTTKGNNLKFSVTRGELNVWEEDGQTFIYFDPKFRFMLGIGVKFGMFEHQTFKISDRNVPYEISERNFVETNNLKKFGNLLIDEKRESVSFTYKGTL